MRTYNGYTNYQTWALKLAIETDEITYRYYMNLKQQLLSDFDNKEEAIYKMSAILHDDFNNAINGVNVTSVEILPLTSKVATGIYHDILQAAIAEADFQEIAVAIME